MKRLAAYLALFPLVILLAVVVVYAWGITAHKFINRKAVLHLPQAMDSFRAESSFFDTHSFDAELRIDYNDSSFFGEWPRHYFNIDDYPAFQTLTHNLDSLIMRFGWEYVKQDGINPWATVWMLDSLTAQLARGDTMAKYTAGDLGHYIADGHEPLRCTVNNDGQFTGNYGIQARYETYMMNNYSTELSVHPDSIHYIASPIDFAFGYIHYAHSLVDSILEADRDAKLVSGWDGSGSAPGSYYAALWQRCQRFTQDQIQNTTVDIASFWYTAWVNAGLNTSVRDPVSMLRGSFHLHQNYPNPFNPLTKISYTLNDRAFVRLRIFSLDGRNIGLLVNSRQETGEHVVNFNASNLPSGVYFYNLSVGPSSKTRKMVLLR